MLRFDIERTQQALQYLVDSSYAGRHITKLRAAVARPRALPFRDECEVLNELLVVGRQSLCAMEKLIEVAEFKRSTRGSYQREFMARKRERERKIVRIESLLSEKTLSLDERMLIITKQHAAWNHEKEAFLREQSPAGWKERNKAISDFWAKKDRELDQKLRALEHPEVHRKTPTYRHWAAPKTLLGEKLASALNRR